MPASCVGTDRWYGSTTFSSSATTHGGATQKPSRNGGQRPHLRVGAHHDEREVVVDELERAPARELAVGLVDDEQAAPCSATTASSRSTVSRGSTVPVGLFGLQTNTTAGLRRARSARRPRSGSIAKSAARSPVTTSVPVIARDVAVQRVRRLEHERAPARAAVGEQQRLQHLVAAVRAEEPRRPAARGDAPSAARSSVRGAIGVAVQRRPRASAASHASTNSGGGGYGLSFVLSRTVDVDLRRVVALERARGRRAAGTPDATRLSLGGSRSLLAQRDRVARARRGPRPRPASRRTARRGAARRRRRDTTCTCLRKSSTRSALGEARGAAGRAARGSRRRRSRRSRPARTAPTNTAPALRTSGTQRLGVGAT